MKNFSTPCVTLMMILVMVYAAPTINPCKEKRLQLEQIKEAARNALKHNLPYDLSVLKISGYPKRCIEKFFCLAGKSLKKAMRENSTSNWHLQTLESALNVYSKNETCHLGERDQYNVKDFLDDIVVCVDYALNNKSAICHK